MEDVSREIRHGGVNRDCRSSSSIGVGFGCSEQTHTATARDKNKRLPFGGETIPHTEGEVGLAGKHKHHLLLQALGTCPQGDLSVCRRASLVWAVIARLLQLLHRYCSYCMVIAVIAPLLHSYCNYFMVIAVIAQLQSSLQLELIRLL